MKKDTVLILLFFLLTISSFGQIEKTKIIDNGGSGPYKAIAVSEKTLPNFVVYRPQDIKLATKTEGELPILVWANGGCMNSSIHHERLLTEVTSQGYIIIAIGELQISVEDRVHEPTANNKLLEGIDWIAVQANNKNSDYYQMVDLNKIAVCGMSCGGAQVMAIADDSRVKTHMMFNSGMGDMTMAGASKESLKSLHGSIIYIVGGESDIAYNNALLDFERINDVPIAFANLIDGGHGGTFDEEFGGSFARITLDWLDWQFKNKNEISPVFLESELGSYPGWTMKTKNFSSSNFLTNSISHEYIAPDLEFTCELKVTIDQPIKLGETVQGERVIIPISGGTFEGPKLKGSVLKGGADYQYISRNGERTELDAVYTIKTDDNVLIQVRNAGLLYIPKDSEVSSPLGSTDIYFRTAPKFEAPVNSKYDWLNNAIFICKPVGKKDYVSIQVWKVL